MVNRSLARHNEKPRPSGYGGRGFGTLRCNALSHAETVRKVANSGAFYKGRSDLTYGHGRKMLSRLATPLEGSPEASGPFQG